MEKLSMAGLERLSVSEFQQATKLPVALVLADVRSGLNVGSVFRTADAFALQEVVLCGITAQPPHREILKTALGSTHSVPWEYFATAVEAVTALRAAGWQLWAVEQVKERVWLQDFDPMPGKRHAFIFGNEVEGVAQEVLARCDGVVEIPQFGTKHSLNVAVAAGIIAWEVCRKLRFDRPGL